MRYNVVYLTSNDEIMNYIVDTEDARDAEMIVEQNCPDLVKIINTSEY